jgi:hypothetical protein
MADAVAGDFAQMPAELPRLRWTRRSIAFLIDCVLAFLAWGIVNNLVTAHIPETVMSLGSVAFFCGYFLLTEGRGRVRASLGKRLLKGAVVQSDGAAPPPRTVVLRAAVLAPLFAFDWDRAIIDLAPEFVWPGELLAISVTLGFMMFNIWLLIRGPGRLMMQDALTDTIVIDRRAVAADAPFPARDRGQRYRRGPPWIIPTDQRHHRHRLPWMIAAAIILVLSLGAWGAVKLLWPRLADLFVAQAFVAHELEAKVWTEDGVRSRCKLTEAYEWMAGETGQRNLWVTVWIPAVAWRATAERVASTVAKTLKVTPGYFNNITVTITTGGTPLNYSTRFTLKAP